MQVHVYHAASEIDACCARVGAGKPLRLGEAEESFRRHVDVFARSAVASCASRVPRADMGCDRVR